MAAAEQLAEASYAQAPNGLLQVLPTNAEHRAVLMNEWGSDMLNGWKTVTSLLNHVQQVATEKDMKKRYEDVTSHVEELMVKFDNIVNKHYILYMKARRSGCDINFYFSEHGRGVGEAGRLDDLDAPEATGQMAEDAYEKFLKDQIVKEEQDTDDDKSEEEDEDDIMIVEDFPKPKVGGSSGSSGVVPKGTIRSALNLKLKEVQKNTEDMQNKKQAQKIGNTKVKLIEKPRTSGQRLKDAKQPESRSSKTLAVSKAAAKTTKNKSINSGSHSNGSQNSSKDRSSVRTEPKSSRIVKRHIGS